MSALTGQTRYGKTRLSRCRTAKGATPKKIEGRGTKATPDPRGAEAAAAVAAPEVALEVLPAARPEAPLPAAKAAQLAGEEMVYLHVYLHV